MSILESSDPHSFTESIITRIPKESIIIKVVDILDFETSIVPEMYETLKRRGFKIITVINKMDCLPIEDREWKNIENWICRISKILRTNIGPDGKKDVVLVSSVTDMGFDKLESRLQHHNNQSGFKSIYVMGRTNSGKSTFLNRFLRFIGYKHMGYVQYKRAVGGITRSPVPSTTLDFNFFKLPNDFQVVDTPGVPSHDRICSHFGCSQDFRDVSPGKKLQPLTYALKQGKTLLIGALARVEVQNGQSALLTTFVSPKVTIHICNSDKAESLLERKGGTFLYPPHGEVDQKLSILEKAWIKHSVDVFAGPSKAHDDICIAGLGWISVYGEGHKTITVWVPEGVKVFRRPSILPKQIQRTGSTQFHFRNRARSLYINRKKKRLVQQMREAGKKELWRRQTNCEQEQHMNPPGEDSSNHFVTDDVSRQFTIVQ
jgi:ribosome biogenesis GTPase A